MYTDHVHDFIYGHNQFINNQINQIMKSNVIVTADKAGNIVTVSKNNPEWGHFRVEQNRMLIDDNGISRRVKLSALVAGKVEELMSYGLQDGTVMPGTIYVKESITPFNKVNPERDLKIAGNTGVICKLGEEHIYRSSFYHPNPLKLDETIEHTNKEEIMAARANAKASGLTANSEFDNQ